MNTSLFELLEWDTAFFGRRIARWRGRRFTAQEADDTLKVVLCEDLDCVYCLIEADDIASIRCAEAYRLTLVDIRHTLSAGLQALREDVPQVCEIRPVILSDIPMLCALARRMHRNTRFYADGHFPHELCGRLYEAWIQRSCEDGTGQVLVAMVDGRPVGYVTCKVDPGLPGRIGLFGVAEEVRGRGIGRQLLHSAMAWFQSQGVREVEVVTQGSACAAHRLYQSAGLRLMAVHLWYHWWPKAADMAVAACGRREGG